MAAHLRKKRECWFLERADGNSDYISPLPPPARLGPSLGEIVETSSCPDVGRFRYVPLDSRQQLINIRVGGHAMPYFRRSVGREYTLIYQCSY